jgi:crotonobetainyl-CoA:carnitine CoA-transferase CaiB-like acyl-CoA transferase
MASSPRALLDDVVVVDLTRVLAGPYCTMMLGDLGADVLKIEEPSKGDDTRGWGPPFTPAGESAYFLAANRNKRSVTLNLKDPRGLELLRRLIAAADVLVDNFRAGTLEGWGLDYDTLQGLRPGLIVCSITGYGQTGPYRDRPGYDFMVQAMGGFMSVTGPEDGEPYRAGIAIADLAAGMFAASAILAALYARRGTGEGHRIDISLLDSQVALLSYVASNYLVSGEPPRRYGNAHPNIVPYQSFRARDAFFAFAAGNDGQWRKFCQVVDRPAWSEDPRFATNGDRVRNRQELVGLLSELFATRTAQEWMDLCQSIGIPAAPINAVDRVFLDPQVQARGLQTSARHPVSGEVPLVAPAVHPDGAVRSPGSATPRGTHGRGPHRAARLHPGGAGGLAPGGSDLGLS